MRAKHRGPSLGRRDYAQMGCRAYARGDRDRPRAASLRKRALSTDRSYGCLSADLKLPPIDLQAPGSDRCDHTTTAHLRAVPGPAPAMLVEKKIVAHEKRNFCLLGCNGFVVVRAYFCAVSTSSACQIYRSRQMHQNRRFFGSNTGFWTFVNTLKMSAIRHRRVGVKALR